MDQEIALGLASDLWSAGRDREPVRTALTVAHALHWVPRVQAALRSNRDMGRSPGNFNELSHELCRNPRNVHRWKSGQQQPIITDFLALAVLLQMPVADLFPPLPWWISHAALTVCGSRIRLTDSVPYGLYLAQRPIFYAGSLDSYALETAMKELGTVDSIDRVKESVLRAARAVGNALLPLGWQLTSEGELS